MIKRIVSVPGILSVPGLLFLTQKTQCDGMTSTYPTFIMNSAGSVGKDEPEDSHWEYKRNSCSFCKMFLDSPCQAPFKTWSSCTDNAKSSNQDPNATCSQYSEALLSCSTSNDEYFRLEAAAAKREKQSQIESGRKKYLTTTKP